MNKNESQMNTTPEVYIQNGKVYTSTRRELTIKDQRGRKYVHYNSKQINIKTLPELKPAWDLFQWYVLDGLFETYPCAVMDWWVEIRMAKKYFKPKKTSS